MFTCVAHIVMRRAKVDMLWRRNSFETTQFIGGIAEWQRDRRCKNDSFLGRGRRRGEEICCYLETLSSMELSYVLYINLTGSSVVQGILGRKSHQQCKCPYRDDLSWILNTPPNCRLLPRHVRQCYPGGAWIDACACRNVLFDVEMGNSVSLKTWVGMH